MAGASSRTLVPKLCPRCGAFYQDLVSQTCPQCFAKLQNLGNEEAADLILKQDARSQDPEYVRLKQVDDDQFKEQAFGACLGVVVVFLGLAILCIALISIAVHRQAKQSPGGIRMSMQNDAARPSRALPDDFDEILPTVTASMIRTKADVDLGLPGTAQRVYHAVYGLNVQVFAVPGASPPPTQLADVRLGVAFVAAQRLKPSTIREVSGRDAYYFVISGDSLGVGAVADALSQR